MKVYGYDLKVYGSSIGWTFRKKIWVVWQSDAESNINWMGSVWLRQHSAGDVFLDISFIKFGRKTQKLIVSVFVSLKNWFNLIDTNISKWIRNRINEINLIEF